MTDDKPPIKIERMQWRPLLSALHIGAWTTNFARQEQLTPGGNWKTWLILAGRGWGKTRTGAEDAVAYGLRHPGSRIAVVAPTFADARDTCIEGESGILHLLHKVLVDKWNRSLGELVLYNGTKYKLFSADEPERLRGPQHHRAWCDEVAAWTRPDALDQLQFGLRLGKNPQVVITTTPKPVRLIRDLVARAANAAAILKNGKEKKVKYTRDHDVFLTRGRTQDNAANLSEAALHHLEERYAGTRLGRQELEAEILDDTHGALWQRATLDAHRVPAAPGPGPNSLQRILVAIDPAMTAHAGSDETGIVCAGIDAHGHAYILADASGTYSPEQWSRTALALMEAHGASQIVAEVNAGGDMVASTLRTIAPNVPFKAVRAARGKVNRAVPIAALYEQGRVHHVGSLAKLEDQMCRFTMTGTLETSPDRVDALVWALTELMLVPVSTPGVRFF